MANSPLLSLRVDQDDLDRLDELVERRIEANLALLGAVGIDTGKVRAFVAREALRIGLETMLSPPPPKGATP